MSIAETTDASVGDRPRLAVVKSEQRVYGPTNPNNSYFQDIALTAPGINESGTEGARERLTRYAMELDVEMSSGSSEGHRAERVAAEYRRSGVVETRSGASSTTIAGFTTPEYYTADWAAYRGAPRSFTDQCTLLPLPEYGLQVNVPSFSSAATTAQQTELAGASGSTPTGANIQVNLTTQAGAVSISQQLFDKGGMSGLAFDKILFAQMKSQLDASIDLYVINQATANAATVTDASSLTIPLFYTDLASAREKLSDTAGTRFPATHIFSTTDFFSWVTRQVDATTNRPILTPDSGALVLAAQMGDPKWDSWTGVHLGQTRWHTDDNIPVNSSGYVQVLVCRPQEVYVFDGDTMSFAYPQTNANTLSVEIGLRAYIGAVVRFSNAIAVISGASYTTALV